MKSLFFILFHLLVLYGVAVSLIREYFYVSQNMNWATARDYCRQKYGDLATITTEEENTKVIEVAGGHGFWAWIGLIRTSPHVNTWQWCDGDKTNFTKWSLDEPNNFSSKGENSVVMNVNGWYDDNSEKSYPSICSKSSLLVEEKKTWEEALQHCRTFYSNMAIVDSQALLDLLKIEIKQAQTASLWAGLHFLNGKWFWTNGTLLGSLVSLPECPVQPYRCGAYNLNTSVWENRDCNEKLNFLCYH